MAYMLYVLLMFVLIPFFILLDGYVFQHLWNWFLVPFVGFPSISLVAAVGISMVISYVAHQFIPSNNGDKTASEIATEAIVHLITKPLAALLFGWIVTLFM